MSRRRKTHQLDPDRLVLLHEAADHLSIMQARRRLGSPETEGDRALLAAIRSDLSEEEWTLIYRQAAGESALPSLTRPQCERLRNSCYFIEKAHVRSGAGGWELLPGDGEVVSLEERRAKRTC